MQLTLMPWQLVLLLICVLAPLGWCLMRWRQWELEARLALARQADLESQMTDLVAERQQQQDKQEQQQLLMLKLNGRLKEYETLLHAERAAGADKALAQQEAESRLGQQFENLAHRLLEQTSGSFRDLNQQHLDLLLSPLRSQLESFRQQIGESHAEESKQRHSLQFELQRLATLNQQITAEAAALTKALKGDSKQQGNWGEVVLSRILSESGLREGHEYELQVAMNTEDGRRYQPDVLVHLPGDKEIIIDAKVSLTAYERYFNAEEMLAREIALKEHVASVRNHVRELGRKGYQQLPALKTLDYVLMFVAVEPAYLLAMEADPGLTKYALDHNILLVSPTNLLVALRTIDALWRQERQQQNARLIAERAGRLYEKLRLFVEEMQAIGQTLGKTHESYERAMGRLCNGRGNLIAQAEQLRELGVEVHKPLPESILARAALGEETIEP
jgi:DNA recombination protein RmuC